MTGPGPAQAGTGPGGPAADAAAERWSWPGAARRLYLTPRGAAAVALLAVCGVTSLTGRVDLVPVAGALAAPVLAGPALAIRRAVRARASVTVRVHAHPVLVPVGGTAVLEVTAFDRGTRGERGAPVLGVEAGRGWWRLSTGPATGPPTGARVAGRRRSGTAPGIGGVRPLVPSRSGGATGLTWGLPTARRGVVEVDGLPLWVHDPFGLFGVAVGTTAPASVVVHPVPAVGVPVRLGGPVRGTEGGPVAAVVSEAAGAGAGEWTGLRPYRPGDRLHLVHWPSLAGHRPVLVREFAADGGAPVRIVVDDRAAQHRRSSFETALSTALALVEQYVARGVPVVLATLTGPEAAVVPGPGGCTGALALLATLEPRGSNARPPAPPTPTVLVTTGAAVGSLPESLRGGGEVVVVP